MKIRFQFVKMEAPGNREIMQKFISSYLIKTTGLIFLSPADKIFCSPVY